MESKLWYLKRCNLFERLTAAEAEHLERRALMRTFKRRAVIYAPTEPGQSVLVLARGRVKIKGLTPDGKETILAFIEEGELFGELAVLGDEPRDEYAEAVEDSQVLVLPRDDLLWLMGQRPDVALSVTKLVGWRRRRIENRLRNLLFLSSRERLVRMLLELVESHGAWHGSKCEISLPLSHQDLAGLIGVTRETATLVLGRLRFQRLIGFRRRRIVVLDYDRLVEETSELPAPPSGRPARGDRREV